LIYSCGGKSELSASLLQASVSHDPWIWWSSNISNYQCWKQLCCL